MTSWGSMWTVVASTAMALGALFLMVGGGFLLVLVVLLLLLITLAGLALSSAASHAVVRTAPHLQGNRSLPVAVATPAAPDLRPSGKRAIEPTIPAPLFAAVLGAGTGIAVVHAYLGLYHLAGIALLATGAGMLAMLGDTVPAVARRVRSELALVGQVVAPGTPMTLELVSAKGDCAWGYRSADAWRITPDGKVSPQVCKAVATSVASAFSGRDGGACQACTVECACPLAGRSLTFVAHRVTEAA